MSMSTKIDDLPGPIPLEVQHELQEMQGTRASEIIQEVPSNIKANLKRKVHFADESEQLSLVSFLNEDNLFVYGFLVLASLPTVTLYVQSLPIIGAYASSDIMTALIKGAVLLVLLILTKIYVLPRVKF